MTFGERLRSRRLELGLTREALAGLARTTHQSIWRWEKGIKSPDGETIARLARALECSVGSLFGEGSEREGMTAQEALEAVRALSARGELTLEQVARTVVRATEGRGGEG